ncbi:hypothetical protein FEM48_ZijujUnG0008800 [Ziziphus jujuba var. spinosa]|uniref:Uncharacterized protein n=1 Tax=Ziziphus jujuba var. spinosa TaxID=714518 RepID=A0A978U9Z4_ZIZJJ|nr:uncharacterized protein LOC107421135 [Ziziphus jujuba var. spinosa]KAH7511475.1 hypothetical protein FEM48_ZijujUnG0008800 [Ziziphus jujuba var. spinosa]
MATQLHDKVVEDVDDMENEETASAACWSSGCGGCMQGLFGFRWCMKNNNNGCSRAYLLGRRQGEEEEGLTAAVEKETWLVKKAKTIKEVSEALAGPKWKNFIRSINKKKKMQFQYDPESYALNFDDGVHVQTEPDSAYLKFSSRYSAAPALGINIKP